MGENTSKGGKAPQKSRIVSPQRPETQHRYAPPRSPLKFTFTLTANTSFTAACVVSVNLFSVLPQSPPARLPQGLPQALPADIFLRRACFILSCFLSFLFACGLGLFWCSFGCSCCRFCRLGCSFSPVSAGSAAWGAVIPASAAVGSAFCGRVFALFERVSASVSGFSDASASGMAGIVPFT